MISCHDWAGLGFVAKVLTKVYAIVRIQASLFLTPAFSGAGNGVFAKD